MKVKDLIRELNKMPPNEDVGVAMGDNDDGEVAGWAVGVSLENEMDMDTGYATKHLTPKYTGKKIVIIRC